MIKCTKSGIVGSTALFDIVSYYHYFDTDKTKYTQTFESITDYYDSDTHEYLGNYLRAYRDIKGINLMPYYNCFSGVFTSKFSIDGGKKVVNTDSIITSLDFIRLDTPKDINGTTYYFYCDITDLIINLETVESINFSYAFRKPGSVIGSGDRIEHKTVDGLTDSRFSMKFIKSSNSNIIYSVYNLNNLMDIPPILADSTRYTFEKDSSNKVKLSIVYTFAGEQKSITVVENSYDSYSQGKEDFNTRYDKEENYKIAKIPIKLNKTYTIAIDEDLDVKIAPAFINNGKLMKVNLLKAEVDLTKSIINLTDSAKIYHGMRFKHPVIYRVSNDNPETVSKGVTYEKLFNDYEKYLYLLIQLPKYNESSIVVLEGDYTDVQTNKVFSEETIKNFSKEIPGKVYDVESIPAIKTDCIYPPTYENVRYLYNYEMRNIENFSSKSRIMAIYDNNDLENQLINFTWDYITSEQGANSLNVKCNYNFNKLYFKRDGEITNDVEVVVDGKKAYFYIHNAPEDANLIVVNMQTPSGQSVEIKYATKSGDVWEATIDNFDDNNTFKVMYTSSLHPVSPAIGGKLTPSFRIIFYNLDSISIPNNETNRLDSNEWLDYMLCSDLSLLQFNDKVSYPYSNRLIEYLLINTIDSEDTIGQNVERVQSYFNLNYSASTIKGAWSYYLRRRLYSLYMSNDNCKHLDISGYVDSDIENYLNNN